MTPTVFARTAGIVVLLAMLRTASAQTPPQTFLYKYLQSFEASAKYTPQTRRERWHSYLLSLGGPATLVTEAGAAGLSQAIDSPWQWGEGPGGYAKRFGNDLAYNGIRYSLSQASSILLNEDGRYFASGQKRTWPRVKHAIAGVFTAHKPDGRVVFATSSVIGIAGASLITRAWSPESWQTPSNTARSMGISIAGAAGFNLVREFLPEMLHRLHK